MRTPSNNVAKPKSAESRANTLRLDQRTLTALLDRVDAARHTEPGARRRFARFQFRRADVHVLLTHPGGSTSELTVCSRDISSGGISLLHSAYVHKGTACNVVLEKPGSGRVNIPGKVVRCIQLAGLIHEVGIAFNNRVSLRELLCPEPTEEFFSLERVNPSELKGRVLHVDNTNLGRRLLQAFLNETSLTVQQAGTIAQAVEACKQPFDVIVAEFSLPDGSATALMEALSLKQINIPVIVLLSETNSEIREQFRVRPPAGVLRKPITQDHLQRCLGEVLLLAKPSETAASATADQNRSALIRVFLDELLLQARDLEAALKADKSDECLRVCRELRGAAPTLGFATVAKAAEVAERAIISGGAAREAEREIAELATMCRRAAA